MPITKLHLKYGLNQWNQRYVFCVTGKKIKKQWMWVEMSKIYKESADKNLEKRKGKRLSKPYILHLHHRRNPPTCYSEPPGCLFLTNVQGGTVIIWEYHNHNFASKQRYSNILFAICSILQGGTVIMHLGVLQFQLTYIYF